MDLPFVISSCIHCSSFLISTIFFFHFREGEDTKKCISASIEKRSYCCWRSGILEVRSTPFLKTRHETQRLSSFSFPNLHLFLLLCFSKYLPSFCFTASVFFLSLVHSTAAATKRWGGLFYSGSEEACENIPPWRDGCHGLPLSASLFLPFSFKKVL